VHEEHYEVAQEVKELANKHDVELRDDNEANMQVVESD